MDCEIRYAPTRLPRPKTVDGTETTVVDQTISHQKRSQSAKIPPKADCKQKNSHQTSSPGTQLEQRNTCVTEKLPVHGYDEPESVSTRKETISPEASSAKAPSPTREEQKKQFFASLKKNRIKREYKTIPQELEDLIGRLCEEKGVKHAAWTQSADWRKVKILGIGASGIISKLETESKAIVGAEEFHFKAIESGPQHLKPLAVKLQAELDNADKNIERSTCELLYQNKFPLTVAHGLFSKKEQEHLKSGPEDTQVRRMRALMKKRPAKISLVIVSDDHSPTQPPSISVEQQPKICYRWYKCECDECEGQQTHLHGYMNDIALFEIKKQKIESAQSRLSHLIPLPDIPPATPDETEPDLKDAFFFVKGRKCFKTAPLKSVPSHENCYPRHIKFSISEGNRLTEGDSGSILSSDVDRQSPFAMLVAVLKADPTNSKDASKAGPKDGEDEDEYVAIWLKPALEEITQ